MADKPNNRNPREIVQEELGKLMGEEKKELAHEQNAKTEGIGGPSVGTPTERKKEISHEEQKEIAAEKKPLIKEESRNDLENDLIRLQAEFDNYRKRTQKEMAERTELGKMEFAKSQVSFLDEFETAFSHFEGEHKKGMEMLLNNFKKSLSSHGVREMECMGKKFDPYLHEVIAQQESDKPEGTVIAVVRKGYMFKEYVLRHAQVIVAKKSEKKGE